MVAGVLERVGHRIGQPFERGFEFEQVLDGGQRRVKTAHERQRRIESGNLRRAGTAWIEARC